MERSDDPLASKLVKIKLVRSLCKFVGRLIKFSDNPIALTLVKVKLEECGGW